MSDDEILRWFQMLAPTNERRRKIVRDLLHNASTDRMSDDNRLICRRVLVGDLAARCRVLPERLDCGINQRHRVVNPQ